MNRSLTRCQLSQLAADGMCANARTVRSTVDELNAFVIYDCYLQSVQNSFLVVDVALLLL